MIHHDQLLQELQEKVARRRRLEAMKDELRAQRSRLLVQVRELDGIRLKEQADVEKLEGKSLARLLYSVTGKREEQLDREREEAYAAAVKYEAAARELAEVEHALEKCLAEYRELNGAELRYARAMQDKAEAVKAAGGPAAQQILQLEQSLSILKSRQKEVREAISAGSQAQSAARAALSSLKKAGAYAAWDVLGGDLLADLGKYGALDTAQGEVAQLQRCLRRFRTELADVSVRIDISVNISGFTRAADFIFDGLLMDGVVSGRIGQARSQVQQVLGQLDSALSRLESLREELEGPITRTQRQIDQLVKETKV